MENGTRRYAVFVLSGGEWRRWTSLQSTPGRLRNFVLEDDCIRAIPNTDWEIFSGPEELMERTIPDEKMREFIRQRIFRMVCVV